MMLVKAVIFGSEEGLYKKWWNVLEVQRCSLLLAKFAYQLLVPAVDAQRGLQADIAQSVDIRQFWGEIDENSGKTGNRTGCEYQ